MGFIRESYLLFPVENYAGKLVDKETSPKYYFMDTGILGLLLMNCETAQLENLVAIELLRRYGEDKFFYFERILLNKSDGTSLLIMLSGIRYVMRFWLFCKIVHVTKVSLTGTQRMCSEILQEDGVCVIPIGCLKDRNP